MCEALLLWQRISPFLFITNIDDVGEYKSKMDDFIKNIKELYTIGGNTFSTKDITNQGGNKTFYMHFFCFYMPYIAKETFLNIT